MVAWFDKPVKSRNLILAVSLFWVLFANVSFFQHIADAYSFSGIGVVHIASVAVILFASSVVLLTLLTNRWTVKPVLILLLMLTSAVAYFMDTYDVVVDTHMITNAIQTNINESADLLSWNMGLYLVLLGVVPSWIVYRLQIVYPPFRVQALDDIKTLGIAMGGVIAVMLVFSQFYTSFFREHKPLRYYANPSYYLYSVGKYVSKAFSHNYSGLQVIGKDAKIPASDMDRELVILVVGEAARADHFSLNGYARETNPLLKKEDIINFSQFSSCGTETAVSVPCMFSSFGREKYEGDKAKHTENVLDVLSHAGVHVLWRDNNSDSKGVALRGEYQDFKTPENNTLCDEGECRDEGMLVGLQEYIDAHPKGDIVIVLHQMGNHGPAYYKRYPKRFEKFTPVCRSNQLEECTPEEITNAYDNAILYTDYFLSKTIAFLRQNDSKFETAMFYVSDHGESLGEKGLYLHGFPYTIAPDAQKHVPAIMWFGKNFAIDKEGLKRKMHRPFTHDSYFHTVLNFTEIESSIYNSELDILYGVH